MAYFGYATIWPTLIMNVVTKDIIR